MGGRSKVPHIRVRHTEGDVAYIPASTAEHYAARGWEPDQFDPAEHTIAEVLAHLEDHPDEAADVLAAESSGKARVALVGKSSTADRSTSPAPAGADTASTKEGTS